MTHKIEDRVIVPDGVLSREIAGETVVLNLDTGIYFGLDAVATEMWRALQAGASLAEVAERVQAAYAVDPAVLQTDLQTFVEALIAKGLVRIADGG